VEHLADLLVVAPCTGNSLSKIALGIDDTPVTTFATTHVGVRPVLVAPAMDSTMYDNPFLQENVRRLKARGVHVLDPFLEERKAKLPDPIEIAEHAVRLAGPRALAGRRVLVIGGATEEPLDEMRVVTNRSSGATAAALAREAWRLGADVEAWWGRADERPPPWIPTRRFSTVADLLAAVPDARGFDAILVPAAISDYGPAPRPGKIPTAEGALRLDLAPLPKVVKALRDAFPGVLVAFKAESGLDEKALVEKARAALRANGASFVVANDVANAGRPEAFVLLVDERGVKPASGPKATVARAILARLAEAWKP
jgi:phosphopantothenoylcysteine decarboxylase/phosphopantothenate--cysteine ligase